MQANHILLDQVHSNLVIIMVNLKIKKGSACSDFNGYCDIFSKCRGVDGQGSLARLANTLLAITQITIEDIKTFASVIFIRIKNI